MIETRCSFLKTSLFRIVSKKPKLVLIGTELKPVVVRRIVGCRVLFPTIPRTQKMDIPVISYGQNTEHKSICPELIQVLHLSNFCKKCITNFSKFPTWKISSFLHKSYTKIFKSKGVFYKKIQIFCDLFSHKMTIFSHKIIIKISSLIPKIPKLYTKVPNMFLSSNKS